MTIKKIQTTRENVDKYLSQTNVIRQTTRETNSRFGKIVMVTDADPDG